MAEAEQLDALLKLHIWRDGELLGPGKASVPVWDHGFLYGDGVFEGIRLRSNRLFRIDDHLRRLQRSSRLIGLTLRIDNHQIVAGIAQTAEANNLADAHVRLLHTRGIGLPGIDPARSPRSSLYILAYPFPLLLGSEPISLITSSVVRKAPRSVDAGAKSLNYLDSVLAKIQANASGAGDAIMLDGQGYVAEATGTNVFCVERGVLRTPPVTAALPGITRETVLEFAAEQGIRTAIEYFSVGDLYVADEAFLTGTGAGIVPIRSIDGRPLQASPGEVTQLLAREYERAWSDPRYSTALPLREAWSAYRAG